MHWKLKAGIQNALSLLPSSASYAAYYWVQRHFGGLRRMKPVKRLVAGIETWRRIREQRIDPKQKVFFEVGTGRVPLVPLAYWLMGAQSTITMDLNPYLKSELIQESLQYIQDNRDDVRQLFGPLLDEKRLDDLLQFHLDGSFATDKFLDLCCIKYVAPGDAANTGLPAGSIDFHTSHAVFEHIPPQSLRQIVAEGNRILRDEGLFVTWIDYSDHFSHSDRAISAINFLRYSDTQWNRFGGNRYMYMNRLRHDDFLALLESAGHCILAAYPNTDQRAIEVLQEDCLPLDGRFSAKPRDVLSITESWVVSRKSGQQRDAADEGSCRRQTSARLG